MGNVQPLIPGVLNLGTITVRSPLISPLYDNRRQPGRSDGLFWNGLTDSLGAYTIKMGPDTSGAPWKIRVENPPYPYTITPIETSITVIGDITGIDFMLVDAAAQVAGYVIDDAGDTLAFSEVSLQRMDSVWMGVGYYTQADAAGRFWFGVPLSVLNGTPWKIGQSNNNTPITTHILASSQLGVLSDGDSVVQNLIVYVVNSSIDGFLKIDGAPPGFPVMLYAANSDSGESFVITDSATGSFSIPVSDKIYNYNLWPNNLSGPYNWPNVTAHPGDTGVIYNLTTGGGGTVSVDVAQGWNLISRPLNTPDPAVTAVYPSANPDTRGPSGATADTSGATGWKPGKDTGQNFPMREPSCFRPSPGEVTIPSSSVERGRFGGPPVPPSPHGRYHLRIVLGI